MKSITPAVAKAEKFLRETLDNGTWRPGDVLPSINSLASSAGVSPVPMWKAIHLLKDEELLEVIQGSGVRVCSSQEPVFALRKGWMGLRDRIHNDILSGRYPPGSLMPSLKELRVNYGVSFQTLKKALDNLASEGSIVPEHRTYRVVSFTAKKSHMSVVLLGWSEPPVELQRRTPWGEDFLRICENVCSQMRLNLKIIRYWSCGDSVVFSDQNGNSVSIGKDSLVLGYILWAESPDDLYRRVLSFIDISRKPVAVLQEGSQLHLSELTGHNRMVKMFSIATGSSAARKVASFLLQLGHKSISYFSAFHKSDWSKARLYGLQEIYSRNGSESKVYQYTLDSYGYSHEFIEALKPPERFLKKFLPDFNPVNQMPQKVFEAFNRLRPELTSILASEAIRMFMHTLFNKAIKNDDCTAWVCSNDYIAFMAMDYLKEYSSKKIALIGFDDTFEAFRRGLTSYNFNIQALVQLMLGYIVNPAGNAVPKRNNTFENEGMLVERTTTFILNRTINLQSLSRSAGMSCESGTK